MKLIRLMLYVVLVQISSVSFASQTLSKPVWDSASWQNRVNALVKTPKKEPGKLVKDIKQSLGMAAAQAVAIMYDGASKVASKESSQIHNKTYYNSSFLTSRWLGDFATMLTTGQPPFETMQSFNSGTLLEVDRNYVTTHLQSALSSLHLATHSYVDSTNFMTSCNFTPGSFNGLVITGVENNTQDNFIIVQQGNQIGTLKPGYNQVALYGAAHEQGDIIFASATQGKGTFRISFKKGSDIISIANATLPKGQQYSTTYAPIDSSADFLAIQIIGRDFYSGASSQTKKMLERTQCINLSELTGPAYVELKIEDSLDIVNDGKVTTIDQSSIAMFYPSIKKVSIVNEVVFPYLFVPKSLQSNTFISAMINFLNIVMGALQTNYKSFNNSMAIKDAINSAPSYYVIKQQEDYFGSLVSPITLNNNVLQSNGQPVQAVIAGLPGTEYIFTSDITDQGLLNLYSNIFKQSSTVFVGKDVISFSGSVSLQNLLKVPNIINKLFAYLLSKYNIRVQSRNQGFAIIGKSSDVKKMLQEIKSSQTLNAIISMYKTVELVTSGSKVLTFTTQEVMKNLSQVAK